MITVVSGKISGQKHGVGKILGNSNFSFSTNQKKLLVEVVAVETA